MPWHFNITAATVVKATPGTIMTVSVIVPGSAVGSVNDCATTGAAAASNQLATIPMIADTANGVIEFNNGACVTGIVVVPGVWHDRRGRVFLTCPARSALLRSSPFRSVRSS